MAGIEAQQESAKASPQLGEEAQKEIEEETKTESAKAFKHANEIARMSAVDAFNDSVNSIPKYLRGDCFVKYLQDKNHKSELQQVVDKCFVPISVRRQRI